MPSERHGRQILLYLAHTWDLTVEGMIEGARQRVTGDRKWVGREGSKFQADREQGFKKGDSSQ